MKRKLFNLLVIVALLSSILGVLPVGAMPPIQDDEVPVQVDQSPAKQDYEDMDEPNPKDYARIRERMRMLEAGQTAC